MYQKDIFKSQTKKEFNELSLRIFHEQYRNNETYRKYGNLLGKTIIGRVSSKDIFFLPVSLFKNHKILTGDSSFKKVFYSSRTSGNTPSKHYIKDLDVYRQSLLRGFSMFYGDSKDLSIFALLPSYLERKGSSLVYMVEVLIKKNKKMQSGFFLHNYGELAATLSENEKADRPSLLLGVTYALLDFAAQYPMKLKRTIVMETGGMKGKRREMCREEVHELLKERLGVKTIHSEYGMTELLSQAYSKGDGLFFTPPWMRIMIRDIRDPLETGLIGKRGLINIIDLANFNSCSFIATDDIGIVNNDGSFRVIGRFDNRESRGCNLMVD